MLPKVINNYSLRNLQMIIFVAVTVYIGFFGNSVEQKFIVNQSCSCLDEINLYDDLFILMDEDYSHGGIL